MIIEILSKTYGKVYALIDYEIYKEFNLDKKNIFCEYNKSKKDFYISICVNNKRIRIHRLITNCPEGFVVDHINGNTRDNRLCNLRICTQKENLRNHMDSLKFKPRITNKLGIRGLFMLYDKRDRRYFYKFKLRGYRTKCFALNKLEEALAYAKQPEHC